MRGDPGPLSSAGASRAPALSPYEDGTFLRLICPRDAWELWGQSHGRGDPGQPCDVGIPKGQGRADLNRGRLGGKCPFHTPADGANTSPESTCQCPCSAAARLRESTLTTPPARRR